MDRRDAEVEAAAKAALAQARGRGPERMARVEGGLSNHVFQAMVAGEAVVCRLGPATLKRESFARERRVIEHVRRAGVPAPEVLAVGEQDGFAFMVARQVEGEIGANHPNRLRTLEDLGRLAAERVHTIRTSGYGCDYGFEPGGRQASWRAWLFETTQADARLALLRTRDLISEQREADLRDTLETVASWTDDPVLNHGDLRLKNVLVDADGAIVALLDWEESLSAPGPHWDLSVALHDLWVDQMQAFLKGYGMAENEVRAAAAAWRLFNALNYAPEVERALQADDRETLERIRTRFSGALDLFGEA